MKTWPFNWHIIRSAPGVYALHCCFHILVICAPVLLGLIEKAIFDGITGEQAAGFNLWTFGALYLSVGLAGLVASFIDIWGEVDFRYFSGALLRHNLLASLLRRPGALALPLSNGEVLSRYRNDVGEVTDFPLWLPHVVGYLLLFASAVGIMASIDLMITLVIFLPLFGLTVISKLAWSRLLKYYEQSAIATDRVSGFLGEMLASVQALKLASAEASVVSQLGQLNDVRRKAKVRERLLHEVMFSITDYTVIFGTAVVLLLAGQRIADGSFSIGDFALFSYYLWHTTEVPSLLGTFMGDYKQQDASIARLVELVPDEPATALVIPLSTQTAANLNRELPQPRLGEPLLEVAGLTYHHAGSAQGIANASFALPRGSLTVITGKIGAGKTTLIRAVLGLLPHQSGEIRWGGEAIDQPAQLLRPPYSAYTPQVARLFSTSLRTNLLLDTQATPNEIQAAVQSAVFEQDLGRMPHGLDTLIGPRGMRLSGGQIQRVAVARMLVRRAELLVCDDLSSALDVETEAALWQRLRRSTAAQTILAVSHRPALLRAADQIILLDQGSVLATGSLEQLLAEQPLMRQLMP